MNGPDAGPATASLAVTERSLLCDLFDELGPHAPTLCEGWDTHHLAAHLYLRESSLVDILKVTVRKAAASVTDEVVSSSDFGELVDQLRRGPSTWSPFSIPQVERLTGTLEFFVHHEDVRRAQLRWTARDLPADAQEEIWSRLRGFAKIAMRRSPVGVKLARTDAVESAPTAKGGDPVTVRGLPSELALFAHGRISVARVEVDGSDSAVRALHGARLGI